jgi:hypothetical protein
LCGVCTPSSSAADPGRRRREKPIMGPLMTEVFARGRSGRHQSIRKKKAVQKRKGNGGYRKARHVCDDSWDDPVGLRSWGLRQRDLAMVTGADSYVAYWRPAGVTPNRCLEFPRKHLTTVLTTPCS